MSFLDNIFTLSAEVVGYLAKLAGAVDESGRLGVDIGGATFSGDISAAVSTETTNGTLAATSDVISVAMEGRPYAGFSIGAGFTGTITFEASFDNGTTWSSVQTYTPGLPPTITAATLSPAGSATSKGIIVPIGATTVRARVSSGAGSALASIRATVAGVMSVFPQLDTLHTDLALITAAITASRLQVDLGSTPTGNLATLAAAITASRMQVDLASTPTANLAALAAAIVSSRMQVDLASTPTANLATLAAAISASRMQVDLASTPTANLASIAAALNPGSSVTNQTSSTNTDATFSSQTCTLGFWVKNISTSSQVAYIKPGATATTGNGWQLNVGDAPLWVPCTNMNTVHHISSASGANLCWQTI